MAAPPGYRGQVGFSSSNPVDNIGLPRTYTFTAADNGKHTFNGLRFLFAGPRTISVFDEANKQDQGSLAVKVS